MVGDAGVCATRVVSRRLRTPFGNAAETLGLLERFLRRAAKFPSGAAGDMAPTWLFLEFVSGMERAMYNAYEGTATLPPPGKAAASFFRANRRVCEGWFSRAREAAVHAARAAGNPAAGAHHAIHTLLRLAARLAARRDASASKRAAAGEAKLSGGARRRLPGKIALSNYTAGTNNTASRRRNSNARAPRSKVSAAGDRWVHQKHKARVDEAKENVRSAKQDEIA